MAAVGNPQPPPFRKAGPPTPIGDAETHTLVSGLTSDYSKQITTLATGTILLSTTFIKDIIKNNLSGFWTIVLVISWVLFFLSIVLGFLVQGKLTGNLWDKSSPDIYEQGLTGLWASQAVCFFAGVFLFAGLAAVNFISPPPATSTSGNTASSGVISLQLPKKSTTTLILEVLPF